MPRKRKKPEVLSVIHFDTIDFIGLSVAYTEKMELAMSGTKVVYGVNNRNSEGNPVSTTQVEIPWEDVPAKLKTELKSVHKRILAHAEREGHIGEGTDRDDLD